MTSRQGSTLNRTPLNSNSSNYCGSRTPRTINSSNYCGSRTPLNYQLLELLRKSNSSNYWDHRTPELFELLELLGPANSRTPRTPELLASANSRTPRTPRTPSKTNSRTPGVELLRNRAPFELLEIELPAVAGKPEKKTKNTPARAWADSSPGAYLIRVGLEPSMPTGVADCSTTWSVHSNRWSSRR